jgi:hypothetical protein
MLTVLLRRIDESSFRHYMAYYHLLQPSAVADGVPDRKLQKLFFESVMEQMAEGGETRQEFRDFALLKTVFLEYIRLEPEASRQRLLEHITRSLANKVSAGSGSQPMVLLAALVSAGSLLPSGTAAIVRIIASACGQQRYRQIAKLLRTFEPASVEGQALQASIHAASSRVAPGKRVERDLAISDTDKSSERATLVHDSGSAQRYNANESGSPEFRLPYDVDDIAVTNAGLVILHPFLKYFFQGLELLDNAWQFTDPDNAYRAVHLLQYLVTGQQASPEYELPLNKILCGLDLAEPVPEEQELTGEQIGECHNLLQVVLQQWQALKTRKTEALRETFLKRNGVLVKGAQGWILKVERNSFDVLLDKLPWPLSLVSLPWAPQLLSVEW